MSDALPLFIDRFDTPIGELLLVADGAGKLRALDWADHEERMLRLLRLHYGKNGFTLAGAQSAWPAGHTGTLLRGRFGAIDRIAVETAGNALPAQRMEGTAEHSRRRRHFLWKARANRSIVPTPSEPWVSPTVPIRSGSWCHAIESSEPTDRSPGTAEGWTGKDGCWIMNRGTV